VWQKGAKMEQIIFWGVLAILAIVYVCEIEKAMKKRNLRIRMTAFFDTLLYLDVPLDLWGEMIQQRRITERIFGKLTRKEYDFLAKVCEARQSNGGEPSESLFSVFVKKLKSRIKR
jgi:hypothetical protein